MPISRSQMPRQMYGLGSLVKSIGKTVKKVVKSPIGKAAILGFTGAGLMGMGPLSGLGGLGAKMGSLFSGGGAGLGSMFSKAKNLYSGLSGAQKLMGAGSLGLAALAGAPEEVQMESQRNVGALRQYLSSYYKNLGYSDNQIAENVARDTSEYTSGQGGYAMGGRVNYQDGTTKQEIVKPSDSMMKDTTTSDQIAKSLARKLTTYQESAKGVDRDTKIFLMNDFKKDLKNTGYTLEEVMRYMKPKMAYGGRMGYANGMGMGMGMEPLPYVTKNGLRGIDFENLSDAQKQYLKNMKEMEDMQQKSLMKKLKKIREGMPENERNMKPVPIRLIGPEGISAMANGGRINRAYGSDDLVEQASGIEGLDININPKGVKELDLRETGGFIPPVGVKEKADDIPAMLSNNEFVFTADAVRAAGGGSVNKGAQVMYDAMKKLENGGTV